MNAPADLDALREYLATRDAACPSCGYNLRGLTSDRCPECHQEIALRVSLVDPRVGLFLVGVVGWALGAGFSLLLLVYVLVTYPRIGGLPNNFVLTLLAGATIQGGVVLLLLLNNRRIRRWSIGLRTCLALVGYAASLANVLIFSAMIR